MIPCSVELGTQPLCKLSRAVTSSRAVTPKLLKLYHLGVYLADGHCKQLCINVAVESI